MLPSENYSALCRNMAATRKAKKVSMADLQKLVAKYHATKSGSAKAVAMRLYKFSSHVMTLSEVAMLEDFLRLPPSKRFKGLRWHTRKNGSLYPAPDRKT